MKKLQFLAILICLFLTSCNQSNPSKNDIKKNAADKKELKRVKKKIVDFLPKAMETANVDSWLILSGEKDKDPLAKYVGAEKAVGTTAVVFFVDHRGVFRSVAMSPENEAKELSKLKIHDKVIPIREGGHAEIMAASFLLNMKRERIAINSSATNPLANGLSDSLKINLQELFDDDQYKLVPSTDLVNAWLSDELPK